MLYPLSLSFKVLAPRIYVHDGAGNLVFYVKESLFKLKEEMSIFADAEQTTPLYKMKADRAISWSVRYNITKQDGTELGSVARHGMRSLWRAQYDIFDQSGMLRMHIREVNPFIRLMDRLIAQVPFVDFFTGFIFNPAYNVIDENDNIVMRVRKRPSFFNRRFSIEQGDVILTGDNEKLVLLSLLAMTAIERGRE